MDTTTDTTDENRLLWTERARGDATRSWESLATEPRGVDEEDIVIDGPPAVRARWLRPAGAQDEPAVLAIHGGGFVSGSIATHRRVFGHLARASNANVVAIDYGYVPDHVYPSQLDQAVAAYRWLHPGHRVVIVGDSCGATLAIGVALRARDEGWPPPAGLLLWSPWTDLDARGSSYDTSTDPFFSRDLVHRLAAGYLTRTASDDPYAVPLRSALRGLVPTCIQVGAEESLLDDSLLLADRLREVGVDVHLDVFDGQLHTFQMGAGRSPVADDAVRRSGAWVRSRLFA
jgi:acetyl esterase/lipase